MFEREFGRTLSPMEFETINGWVNNGVKPELIKDALKEAVLSGVTTIRYIEAIIREWSKNGGKKTTKRKEKEEPEEYSELFDCEWLDEE